MDDRDEKYLLALLDPLKKDTEKMSDNWRQDMNATYSRLNILEQRLTTVQTKSEVKWGMFGSSIGLVIGLVVELIIARVL